MNLTPYYAPTYFSVAYFAPEAIQLGLGGGAQSTSGSTPYNAPAFFAPAFFAPAFFAGGSSASSLPIAGGSPYNPATYFPSAYFYGPVPADSKPAPIVVRALVGRDGGAYAALLASLGAAREFASIRFGDPSHRESTGGSVSPRAVVIPQGWEESDETDPILLVRRASFVVRLTIRVDDDLDPFDELDRLTQVVQTRVDRLDLGGVCLPGLTRIKAGRYQAPDRYPEWSVDLDGEFTTLIDPASA